MIDTHKIIASEDISFGESFQLILDNSQLIINTPDFYDFRLRFMGFAGFYGQLPVCLGHLIQPIVIQTIIYSVVDSILLTQVIGKITSITSQYQFQMLLPMVTLS